MQLYYGVVENRNDPLKIGRCQVRIVGLHTHDKSLLPTTDLPWATPMQPVTSAAMNGIGWSPVGPVEGTSVIITFADTDNQQPIMLGTIGGIPQSKAAAVATEDSGEIATDGGVIIDSTGNKQTRSDGSPMTITNKNEPVAAVGNLVDNAINSVSSTINGAINTIISNVNGFLGTSIASIGIGSVSNQPQQLTLPVGGTNDERKETVVPNVVSKADAKIDAQPEPGKANPVVLNTPITVEPPSKYVRKGTDGIARESCSAIVEALDKVGITHKYAKAAILGICGGESQWLPVEEDHAYRKADALLTTFASIFQGDRSLAEQYTYPNKTKSEFFELIYGHKYSKGKGLGNTSPGDGGKYYGRGFNGLTGKSNYLQMQNEMKKYGVNIDLVGNPSLLIDDIKTAALACAIYYKVNCKHPQDDPGYFEAAKKATGKNAGKGYEIKKICYEYFLGQGVIAESTNKPSTEDVTGKTYTKEEVAYLPKEKQAALLEDRSDFGSTGFKDPNGKYPLRNLLDEPDTNRLSRGVIKETAIAFKDQIRTTGIKSVFGSSWEQPLAPFGGKYPYNKVYETESGHVMMFDDTGGHETVSLYHRKGTFIDIDANGTQVNKIVGDGYTIYDRNGMIYVTGKCNLTVGNSVNILVQGDANIEVNGETTGVFHGRADLGFAKDVDFKVGGDFNLSVEGNFNTWVAGDKIDAVTGNVAEFVSGGMSVDVTGDLAQYTGGTTSLEAKGDLCLKSTGSVKTDAAVMLSLFGKETRLTGSDIVHVKSTGGVVALDGTQLKAQQGVAVETEGFAAQERGSSPDNELTAPAAAEANADGFPLLDTPVRPAPPIEIKAELQGDGDIAYNPSAEAAGVSSHRYEQPNLGSAAPTDSSPPAQGLANGDMYDFLTKQLALAKEGHWCEIGMKDNESCAPLIKQMWKDIGLGSVPEKGVTYKGKLVKGDQIPWCAAFVSYCLKNTGYRWIPETRAYGYNENSGKLGATKVTDGKVQPGDVVVWNYSHVSLVYDVFPDGTFYSVGGNQGGKDPRDNNPVGGMVTIAGKGGPLKWKPDHSSILAIWRMSKK